MELVITRDLHYVSRLSLVKPLTGLDEDKKPYQQHTYPDFMVHPKLLNKGLRVQVGTSEKQDELSDAEKETVLWLHHSKAIVPLSDKSVERVDREVKADIAKQIKEREPVRSMEETIAAAVATALVAAGVIPAKKAT